MRQIEAVSMRRPLFLIYGLAEIEAIEADRIVCNRYFPEGHRREALARVTLT